MKENWKAIAARDKRVKVFRGGRFKDAREMRVKAAWEQDFKVAKD